MSVLGDNKPFVVVLAVMIAALVCGYTRVGCWNDMMSAVAYGIGAYLAIAVAWAFAKKSGQ